MRKINFYRKNYKKILFSLDFWMRNIRNVLKAEVRSRVLTRAKPLDDLLRKKLKEIKLKFLLFFKQFYLKIVKI